MGQIKNIKLHIVTDIKVLLTQHVIENDYERMQMIKSHPFSSTTDYR